jgi:transcriptional regulator with XRE-family HTH domain
MVARTLRRLSQPELAERMNTLGFPGWRQSTVSQVERGRRSVDIDELWSLAMALNTTIDWLVDPTHAQGAEHFTSELYLGPDTPTLSVFVGEYFLSNHDKEAGYPPWPGDGVRALWEKTEDLDGFHGERTLKRVLHFHGPESRDQTKRKEDA